MRKRKCTASLASSRKWWNAWCFSDDSLHNNLFTNLSGPSLVVASLEKKSWLQEKDCRLPSGIRSYHPSVIKESQNSEVPGSIETNVWPDCRAKRDKIHWHIYFRSVSIIMIRSHYSSTTEPFFLKTLIDHIFTIYAVAQQHLSQYQKKNT